LIPAGRTVPKREGRRELEPAADGVPGRDAWRVGFENLLLDEIELKPLAAPDLVFRAAKVTAPSASTSPVFVFI